MALRDFKVLTFDVVGTLIDFEGGMLAYLRRAVPDSKVTDEDFLGAYRAARKRGWTRIAGIDEAGRHMLVRHQR